MEDIKELYDVIENKFDRYGEFDEADECCQNGHFDDLDEAIKHAKAHLNKRDGYAYEVLTDTGNSVFQCQTDWTPDADPEDYYYDSYVDSQLTDPPKEA